MAIMLAGLHPAVHLLGVSTVAGNQTVEKTTLNALRVLALAHIPGVGVYDELMGSTGMPHHNTPPLILCVHGLWRWWVMIIHCDRVAAAQDVVMGQAMPLLRPGRVCAEIHGNR